MESAHIFHKYVHKVNNDIKISSGGLKKISDCAIKGNTDCTQIVLSLAKYRVELHNLLSNVW